MSDPHAPLAVLSDIHANLEAFRAVLDDLDSLGVAEIVSLGDVVGYGPDPDACLDLLRTRSIVSVLGNHEWGLLNKGAECWFNPCAKDALCLTRSLISASNIEHLRTFPETMLRRGQLFVHGAPPKSYRKYLFQYDDEALAKKLKALKTPLCFCGHTHDLDLYWLNGTGVHKSPLKPGLVRLDLSRPHIINAGSVGQPRDGDPRAKYVIWRPAESNLDVRAVPYDNARTADKIRRLGFPETYAARLL